MRPLNRSVLPLLVLPLLTAAVLGCGHHAGTAESAGEPAPPDHSARVLVNPGSDAEAIELAQSVMEKMGGWPAWDATRFVSWNFFGRRTHHWDRGTGRLRFEYEKDGDRHLVLMDLDDRQGRSWSNGEPLEGEELSAALEAAYAAWINDSYWMFMPYKLLDPGVNLKWVGPKTMADGRPARVVELTFSDDAGLTPQNRYEVYVADDSGLVEQWDFYANAADAEPAFNSPWKGWQRFGSILLATDHGNDRDWEIAVYETLPDSVFEDPSPVGSSAGS